MADPLLRGARRARHAVHDHLKARLNERIQGLLALDVDVLPIAEWHRSPFPRDLINKWPAVIVHSLTGTNLGRIDWEDGSPVYQWNWLVRVYVWARGENYESTADRVEQIADCIASELLGRPGLSDPEDRLSILPGPMTVALSNIEPVEKMRASIAGAYVEAVVTMAETATADPPYGVAEQIDLVVAPKDPPA